MPKIEDVEGGVRVTFQRNNVSNSVKGHNVPKDDLKNVLQELSDRQKDIVARLIETGHVNVLEGVLENALETSASLASHFKVDARTIRRELSVLQTKGVIRHDGPDKGGRWLILIDKTK